MTAALSPFAWLAIANGWGQLSLAEVSGVPADTIRRLWVGRNRPSHRTANQLAGLLRVDPADVIDPLSWLVGHGLAPAASQRTALLEPASAVPAVAERAGVSPAARVARAYATPATGERGWRQRAACLEVDPEVFWPEPGQSADAALQVCVGCPVLGDCRGAFLAQPRDEGGVWFATTLLDRQARSARQAVAA